MTNTRKNMTISEWYKWMSDEQEIGEQVLVDIEHRQIFETSKEEDSNRPLTKKEIAELKEMEEFIPF